MFCLRSHRMLVGSTDWHRSAGTPRVFAPELSSDVASRLLLTHSRLTYLLLNLLSLNLRPSSGRVTLYIIWQILTTNFLLRTTVPDVEEGEEGGDKGALRRELLGALVQGRIQVRPGCDRSRSTYHISLPSRPPGSHLTLIWVHPGLSDDVKKTIEGLKGVDTDYLAILKQFKKESLELEAKVRSRVQSDRKTPTKATPLYRFLATRLS